MARPKVVSRTFRVLRVESLCVDISTNETFNQVDEIPFEKNEKKILETIREMNETDEVKVAAIINITVEEALYTMPESEFLRNATKNPPRGTEVKAEAETTEA